MSMRKRFLVTPVCLLSVVVPGLCGCEDAESRQRTEAQRIILQASQEFRAATQRPFALEDETDVTRIAVERVRANLTGVIDRLNQAPEGSPAQQAARALLTAETLHELAGLDRAQIASIEREHRTERRITRSRLEHLIRLEALAAAREALDTQQQRDALRRERQATEAAVQALAQRVGELERPIAQLTEENRRDAEEANRLREQANDLLRRAVDLGYSDGFPSFEQGVQRRRQADRIDFEIAHREIELGVELEPEHARAAMMAEHVQSLIASIGGMLRTFDEMDQARHATIARLRSEIDAARRDVVESLRRLDGAAGAALSDLYDDAAGQLERAAAQARQAASRLGSQEAQSARLTEARSLEMLGRLHAQRAGGIMDHLMLLATAVESGTNAQAYAIEMQALLSTQLELVDAALEAFAGAEEALERVTGRDAANVEAYRASIQRMMASLSGEAVDWSTPDAPVFDDAGFSLPGMGVGGVPDFTNMSAEELMSLSGPASPEAMLALLDAFSFDEQLEMTGMKDAIPPEMLPRMREVYQRVVERIKQRIRNGEFTTYDELGEALGEAVFSEMMGGGMGGFPQ